MGGIDAGSNALFFCFQVFLMLPRVPCFVAPASSSIFLPKREEGGNAFSWAVMLLKLILVPEPTASRARLDEAGRLGDLIMGR
jgi:hypothetical protein